MEQTLQQGAGLDRGIVKGDGLASRDDLHVDTRLMHERCQVHRRCSRADDGNTAPAQCSGVVMLRAVGDVLRAESRKRGWYVAEVGDAYGQHDFLCRQRLTVLGTQLEARAVALEQHDVA